MKRRELLKSSLLGIGASALALSGCNKEEVAGNSDELNIVPKQTGTYKFSAPLLFDFNAIDEMANYNKEFKKSQISTLYNSIPWPQAEKYNEWFMLSRGGSNPDIKTYYDFEKYVKYAMDKGFDIVYLMNSPKTFEDKDIEPIRKDLYKLLDNLWKTGIRKIKFANTQVAQVINEYNPDFELHVATILEYSSVAQYRYLLGLFPNIKHICIAKDQNQNFQLLSSLKKTFPKIEIEMMIDEHCIKNCPTRLMCMSMRPNDYKLGCNLTKENKNLARTMNGIIHPWDLAYYSALGINNFKTCTASYRASDKITRHTKAMLSVVEFGIDSDAIKEYLHHIIYGYKEDIEPKKFISLLPKMEYFVKHGSQCASRCGVECNYCFECAKKIEQLFIET